MLYAFAPLGGAFSWPDAPRHAMNGAFVLDLIRAAPFADPVGFAYGYYAQYPALTILFYPPLFYFVLAPFYAVFGVSQESALLAVAACYVVFALGAYTFFRLWLDRPGAFAAALLFVVIPELAFWGRQVMLELPAYAFLIWSAVFFTHYLRTMQIKQLYISALLLVLAIYSKNTVVFVALVYFFTLVTVRKGAFFRDQHTYIVAVSSLVLLGPLIYLTLEFGQGNVQSVYSIADSQVSRLTLAGWLWYAKALPTQMGWPPIILAVALVVIAALQRLRLFNYAETVFLASWFGIGYLFFSGIDLKDARFTLFILVPVPLLSVLAIYRLLPQRASLAAGLASLLAMGTLGYTLLARPVHYVDGYRDLVDYIAEVAPPHSVVLFSGYRDGAFIFNLRSIEARRDLSVLRSDKLLLKIKIRRELGVEEADFSREEIADLINRHGVHYVVAQPDFWTDLDQMAKFQEVLDSPQFEKVARFPMTANYPNLDKEYVVYRNLGDVAQGPIPVTIRIPMIGRTISSEVGNSQPHPPRN